MLKDLLGEGMEEDEKEAKVCETFKNHFFLYNVFLYLKKQNIGIVYIFPHIKLILKDIMLYEINFNFLK